MSTKEEHALCSAGTHCLVCTFAGMLVLNTKHAKHIQYTTNCLLSFWELKTKPLNINLMTSMSTTNILPRIHKKGKNEPFTSELPWQHTSAIYTVTVSATTTNAWLIHSCDSWWENWVHHVPDTYLLHAIYHLVSTWPWLKMPSKTCGLDVWRRAWRNAEPALRKPRGGSNPKTKPTRQTRGPKT